MLRRTPPLSSIQFYAYQSLLVNSSSPPSALPFSCPIIYTLLPLLLFLNPPMTLWSSNLSPRGPPAGVGVFLSMKPPKSLILLTCEWLKWGGTPFLGPQKLLASAPRPHTAVNGTSRLRVAPSAYSRAPNFFGVPGPLNLYFNYYGVTDIIIRRLVMHWRGHHLLSCWGQVAGAWPFVP